MTKKEDYARQKGVAETLDTAVEQLLSISRTISVQACLLTDEEDRELTEQMYQAAMDIHETARLVRRFYFRCPTCKKWYINACGRADCMAEDLCAECAKKEGRRS